MEDEIEIIIRPTELFTKESLGAGYDDPASFARKVSSEIWAGGQASSALLGDALERAARKFSEENVDEVVEPMKGGPLEVVIRGKGPQAKNG